MQDGAILPAQDYPLCPARKISLKALLIINPLLTKLVRSRWLDIGLILFCDFMDLNSLSFNKLAKIELGQYPAILTSHLVNRPYMYVPLKQERLLDIASSLLYGNHHLFKTENTGLLTIMVKCKLRKNHD